jgi:hypothetical protein
LLFAFALSASFSFAATPNWDVSGTWTATHEYQGNTYPHENNIVQASDGTLTGSGGWDGTQNGNPISTPNTWNLTSGTVSGDTIHFNYHYTSVEVCAHDGSVDAAIADNGSMAGTWQDDCGSGRTGAWTAPAGSAVFVRSAEITSPEAGDEVSGTVSFDATLTDKDKNDNVQWAVRKGTCAAGTGTVLGNVDGFNDSFTWDHTNFHASADVFSWTPGDYCFVFNPTESAGDATIRETREFKVVLVGPPTDKDQCKNDGWKTFNNPVFKNQGECVSYVANGKAKVKTQVVDIYHVNNGDSDQVDSSKPYKGKVVLTSNRRKTGLIVGGFIKDLKPNTKYFLWVRNLDSNGGYTGKSLFSYSPLGYYKLMSFKTNRFGSGMFGYRIKKSALPAGTYDIQVAINDETGTSNHIGSTVAATEKYASVVIGN